MQEEYLPSNTLNNDLIQRLILENYQQETHRIPLVNEESAEIDHQKASAPSQEVTHQMALLDTIPIATPRST